MKCFHSQRRIFSSTSSSCFSSSALKHRDGYLLTSVGFAVAKVGALTKAVVRVVILYLRSRINARLVAAYDFVFVGHDVV